MANVEFNPVVEGTKGALSKSGLVTGVCAGDDLPSTEGMELGN